jgi:hypothetical protein
MSLAICFHPRALIIIRSIILIMIRNVLLFYESLSISISCRFLSGVGDAQYFCTVCNAKQNAEKQTRFDQLPDVLIVHINRTAWVRSSLKKIQSHVSYPQVHIYPMRDQTTCCSYNRYLEIDPPDAIKLSPYRYIDMYLYIDIYIDMYLYMNVLTRGFCLRGLDLCHSSGNVSTAHV